MPDPVGTRPLHLWSLRGDVVVEQGEGDGDLVLRGSWGTERIANADPLVREALRRMELGPVLLANVEARREPGGDRPGSYFVLLPTLVRLSHLLVRSLGLDDFKGPLLSVSPLSPDAFFAPVRLPARRRVRLPAGASLTLEPAGAGLALESSGSAHRVVLHRPEAAWVAGLLAWPVTPDAASARLPLPPEVTAGILDYLAAAGMAAPVG
ncbi:NADH oxidase [Streptomyces hiroshimensis]|uniref:NADH oxidase n=1 Tax=Streptomyces hiroshimensis TaxID=66424 RepID=A0ABQ2YYQ9_9ACTN|nr:NADH oxidase [Streptomyces hiroshimensis]GGX96618.1 hypothetical protein GCM10010324_48260 [Streptomyces hiroshimensis]